MPNLTIKGVPVELHAELKRRAAAARRSLNSEILTCLEQALLVPEHRSANPAEFVRQVREMQKAYQIKPITDAMASRYKRQGRP